MKKIGGGLEEVLMKQAVERTDDRVARRLAEQQRMDENEFYEIDFAVTAEQSPAGTVGILAVVALLLVIKCMGKDALRAFLNGKVFDMQYYNAFPVAICVFMLSIVLLSGAYYLVLARKAKPRIRQSVLYFKERSYHYSEITKIKVCALGFARVYINGKYAFWICSEMENYQSFLAWAEKCNIPVQGNAKPQGPTRMDTDKMGQKAVMATLVIVAVVTIITLACFLCSIV